MYRSSFGEWWSLILEILELLAIFEPLLGSRELHHLRQGPQLVVTQHRQGLGTERYHLAFVIALQ